MVTFAYCNFSKSRNSVYGWTTQNSAMNSKNFVQRIFFELLYRLYKKYKYKNHKVPSKFSSFIHPVCPQFAWIPFWWPLSQQCAYAFFYPPIPKKTLRKLFCFVSYLIKIISLTFLFSESHVRADKPRRQCVKHNVSGWTYFWGLVGTICFTMGQAKRKLKNVRSQTFF